MGKLKVLQKGKLTIIVTKLKLNSSVSGSNFLNQNKSHATIQF